MEKVNGRKAQSQYLSLVVKKTIQDRLSRNELETYSFLKSQLDPLGNLEEELMNAWRTAEDHTINSAMHNRRKKKFSLPNLFRRTKSY